MEFQVAAASETGHVRKRNEDSLAVGDLHVHHRANRAGGVAVTGGLVVHHPYVRPRSDPGLPEQGLGAQDCGLGLAGQPRGQGGYAGETGMALVNALNGLGHLADGRARVGLYQNVVDRTVAA